jgi:predicted NUDIX family phosphoesterase
LSGNVSIGYGGHIDLEDVVSENSVLNFLETIKKSTARELSEEVKVSVEGEPIIMFRPEFMGWMIDSSNDVGCLHVAYLQVVTLPEEAVVAPLEDELHPLESYTLRELLNSNLPLEVWTRSFALYLAELT